MQLAKDNTKDEVIKAAMRDPIISRELKGKEIVDIIYVPNKVLNFVTK